MRIIGGVAAGVELEAPEGLDVRPTLDKVKLAIFNSLGTRVENARVLDLFSGSGALGLECLSRGARSLVSVELSPRHAKFYRKNLDVSGLPASAVELRVADVFAVLAELEAASRTFDLVLADPPFGPKNVGRRSTSLSQRLLDDARLPRLMAEGGIFALGHARRDSVEVPNVWAERRELKHGDSRIRMLYVRGEGDAGDEIEAGGNNSTDE